jgi:hypothetical protein
MSDPWAPYFIKFFSNEHYADQFRLGRLHLNRLSYFKTLEKPSQDGRADAAEAIAMWWQPDDFAMDLNIPNIGATRITKKDLAGPVSMSFDAHNHVHVFCLYAMYAAGYSASNGGFQIETSDVERLRAALTIDERCFQFGRYAVVVSVGPFLNRLRTALRLFGKWHKAGLVHYYDEAAFHGEIPRAEIPFWKQKRFDYQKEYRVVVRTGTRGFDPLTLPIGDITAFSATVEASKLNSIWQLQLATAA